MVLTKEELVKRILEIEKEISNEEAEKELIKNLGGRLWGIMDEAVELRTGLGCS